jgi:hypothetical protein
LPAEIIFPVANEEVPLLLENHPPVKVNAAAEVSLKRHLKQLSGTTIRQRVKKVIRKYI